MLINRVSAADSTSSSDSPSIRNSSRVSLTCSPTSLSCSEFPHVVSTPAYSLCMPSAIGMSLGMASFSTGLALVTIPPRLSGRRAPCAAVLVSAFACEGSRFFLPSWLCGPPHVEIFPHIDFSPWRLSVHIPTCALSRVSSCTLGSC